MANKKTCYYYWLIEPVKSEYKDSENRIPAFNIQIDFEGKGLDFALYLSEAGYPEFARLSIPDLDEERISEDMQQLLQAVKEHLISALRYTYKPDANIFPYSMWTFVEPQNPYSFGFDLDLIENYKFDAERTKSFFVNTFPMREEIRLLIHGLDDHLPLQYRFLSFYKILENRFKSKGEWKREVFKNFLDQYKMKFKEHGFNRNPENLIHELRDKCAHLKTGKRKEIFGVTELNREQTKKVRKVIPIMAEMCFKLIDEAAGDKFSIGYRGDFQKML